MSNKAAKSGRWLGYADFNRIVDERNAAPEMFINQSAGNYQHAELITGSPTGDPND